ncbi:MAG: hypothetical protein ACREOF_12355 [Gemmatimonadales bacterium]
MFTLAYVLGVASGYAALGLLAGLTGPIFGSVSSKPLGLFRHGPLLLVFGLALLGVIPMRAPPGW